jgi:hypothetical protein
MARELNRFGLAMGAALTLLACSSDENGVITPDGAIEELGAAGSGGSAVIDSSVTLDGAEEATTSTDGAPTDAADASLAADAGDAGDAGAMCNTVTNQATVVTPTLGTGAAPTLTGGTVTDGTYVETMLQQFGGDGGLPPPEQSTIVLSAGTFAEVVKVGTTETRLFSTFTVTDASVGALHIITTCDSTMKFTGAFNVAYQASPTTFVYSFDNNGGTLVKTYTKK